MIILFSDSEKYYVVRARNTIEMVKALNVADIVVKVFNDDEGMLPSEYICEYDMFINNNHAVITKQQTDVHGMQATPVLIESSWMKKVSPIVPSTGPSYFEMVLDLDNNGQLLEDYYADNYESLIVESKNYLEHLRDKYDIEDRMYTEFRAKSMSRIPSINMDSNDMAPLELISLTELSSAMEIELNSLILETDLFLDFTINMRRIKEAVHC